MRILVTQGDDVLYYDLISFLSEVKVAQGGQSLSATLVRHPKIRKYLKEKQRAILDSYESKFFNPDGSVDVDCISQEHKTLQNVFAELQSDQESF